MNQQNAAESALYKSAFLDLFPEECQECCIVAKAAATRATKSILESGITLEKAVEVYAHRFGGCALGPNIVGMCGKKSICTNEIVSGIENPLEAAEVLAEL